MVQVSAVSVQMPSKAKNLTAVDGPLHAAYIHVAVDSRWRSLIDVAPVISFRRTRHVAATIAALIDETLEHGDRGPVRPLAEALLCYLDALGSRGFNAAEQAERSALESLWSDVAAHLNRPWNVSALARQAGLSEGHFHRWVQVVFGRSPMAMIRLLRLERAAGLLRTTTVPLDDIAHRVGYPIG